jgi:hypothetical protein
MTSISLDYEQNVSEAGLSKKVTVIIKPIIRILIEK